jgi:hypothetical protein
MSGERTKLRVKLGAAEIEYEGGTEFLKLEVMPTIGKMLQLVETEADLRKPQLQLPSDVKRTDIAVPQSFSGIEALSTNTLAVMFSAESATDLAIVAAARLIMFGDSAAVNRQQILDEMRTAPAYFKKSYVNNHSNTLRILVKADRLRLVANDSYTLSPKERKTIEDYIKKADSDDAG